MQIAAHLSGIAENSALLMKCNQITANNEYSLVSLPHRTTPSFSPSSSLSLARSQLPARLPAAALTLKFPTFSKAHETSRRAWEIREKTRQKRRRCRCEHENIRDFRMLLLNSFFLSMLESVTASSRFDYI